jgi:hypothetical protein
MITGAHRSSASGVSLKAVTWEISAYHSTSVGPAHRMLRVPLADVPAEHVLRRRQPARITSSLGVISQPGQHLLVEVGPQRLWPTTDPLAQHAPESDRPMKPPLRPLLDDVPRVV